MVTEILIDIGSLGTADLKTEVGFGSKANVEIGEELVLYAIPQQKIIGIGGDVTPN